MRTGQTFSRWIWVRKDEIGCAYPCSKKTSDQLLNSRCSHYMTEDSGDVKLGGKRIKEPRSRLGSCVLF
jgi:hypothetical protein